MSAVSPPGSPSRAGAGGWLETRRGSRGQRGASAGVRQGAMAPQAAGSGAGQQACSHRSPWAASPAHLLPLASSPAGARTTTSSGLGRSALFNQRRAARPVRPCLAPAVIQAELPDHPTSSSSCPHPPFLLPSRSQPGSHRARAPSRLVRHSSCLACDETPSEADHPPIDSVRPSLPNPPPSSPPSKQPSTPAGDFDHRLAHARQPSPPNPLLPRAPPLRTILAPPNVACPTAPAPRQP